MSKQGVDRTRRRLLTITTGIGAVGVGFVAAPFVISMMPSARAKAAGAPVEVDISKIEPVYPNYAKTEFRVPHC